MENKDGRIASDRAFVPAASSPQAVSPVPASIPCAVPCLICGGELRNVLDTGFNQPSGGLEFSTPGHYGTTVFDPMDGTRLVVNVCDNCLVRSWKRVLHETPRGVRPWCPPASAMSAGTAETQSGSGLQPAGAVGNAETPNSANLPTIQEQPPVSSSSSEERQ